MGQFSWITQDTNEAIRECYGCEDTSLTTAYMHDNKGNVWEETKYEGYGVFGGKDFFQLVAEMNNAQGLTGDVDKDRIIGIDIYHGKESFISPNLTRKKEWNWVNEKPEDDPNQGWGDDEEEEEYDTDEYDFDDEWGD